MNHTLSCLKREGYLRILIKGEWQKNKPDSIVDEIRKLSLLHSCDTLLIDIKNLKSTESVVREYYDSKLFVHSFFNGLKKVAVVDIIGRQKTNEFFMSADPCREVIFKFFYADEQDAINWLLQDKP